MRDEKQKIRALLILEVLGKPPKYLTDTLQNLINQMGGEVGISVKNSNIREPKKMEEKASVADSTNKEFKIEQNDFYISFAEIELEAENILNLVAIMFKYMPAHVEIVSPENIPATNIDMNEVLNELIRKLHSYDEVARVLQVEKAILENKLNTIMEENKEIEKIDSKKTVSKKTKKK
ncbi:MAG: hypothetical protein KGH55_02760 [Nanoarchaeota archaeon]|nr:hypothetical protein [Nanoarchaeota archaeon]